MNTEKKPLLRYLADASKNEEEIPSIAELSSILGVSIASVREQLEVARQLGFVEVRPRTGIQVRPFSLGPLLNLGLSYGMHIEPHLLADYSNLRKHLELGYWEEAVKVLNEDQFEYMQFLVDVAFRKLMRKPAIIPDEEQSEFHLTLFRPLKNKVLVNLLEVYWVLEANNGGKFFTDLDDMLSNWSKRKVIVEALIDGDFAKGRSALESLLVSPNRPKDAEITLRFE